MQARVDWIRGLLAAGMMIAFGGLLDAALAFGVEPMPRLIAWGAVFLACAILYGRSGRR